MMVHFSELLIIPGLQTLTQRAGRVVKAWPAAASCLPTPLYTNSFFPPPTDLVQESAGQVEEAGASRHDGRYARGPEGRLGRPAERPGLA